MNYKVSQDTIDAARALLAHTAGDTQIQQVHSITLREVDANQDDPSVIELIPIGSVLGVVIKKAGAITEDKDIVFVSMSALGNCLPALGFSVVGPVSYIIPPKNT